MTPPVALSLPLAITLLHRVVTLGAKRAPESKRGPVTSNSNTKSLVLLHVAIRILLVGALVRRGLHLPLAW